MDNPIKEFFPGISGKRVLQASDVESLIELLNDTNIGATVYGAIYRAIIHSETAEDLEWLEEFYQQKMEEKKSHEALPF